MAKTAAVKNEAIEAMAQVARENKQNRTLPPRRVTIAESAFNRWNVIADAGTTQDDLENSAFWTHNIQGIRRGDEVRVVAADGSFIARGDVLATGPKDILVDIWQFRERESVNPEALSIPSEYSIEWAGELEQFRVLRGTELVKSAFQTRGQAQQWLGDYVRSMTK